MKIVYIAGKFTGANTWVLVNNTRRAEELGFEVAKLGAMPLIPHNNTAHFFGTLDEEFWYAGTMELLRRCDAVLTVPGWGESKGATNEVAEAARRGIRVFHDLVKLKWWLEGREERTYARAGT